MKYGSHVPMPDVPPSKGSDDYLVPWCKLEGEVGLFHFPGAILMILPLEESWCMKVNTCPILCQLRVLR